MNTVKLKVSPTVVARNQKQITIKGLKDRPRSFKTGVTDTIKITYPLGKEKVTAELVVGDTHGIHPSHQTEEGLAHFENLFSLLSTKRTVKKDGKDVEVNPIGREFAFDVEVTEAEVGMTDASAFNLELLAEAAVPVEA